MRFDVAIDLFIADWKADGQIRSPHTERAYCALRAGRPEHTPEAEPVLIETVGEAVVFVLDDGERLEFDRVELLSALGAEVAGDMGRLRAA